MKTIHRSYMSWAAALSTVAYFGLVGCSGDEGFISDNPKGVSYQNPTYDGEGTGSSGSGSGSSSSGSPAQPEAAGDDAERAISEADILQVKDNKLYALSRYSGLSIIDISVKDKLRLIGRRQVSGVPFEMYLRDGLVYAMFSDWGQYIFNDSLSTWSWVQSSRVQVLDVSNPESIQALGSYDLPGAISDSRIVGDVLYTVTFEDGYCWGCGLGRVTTVTSLNVASKDTIGVVDQLSLDDNDPYNYGWRRSVSVTKDRMYIAGVEWDGQSQGHSTIDVVDISDPSGHLVKGASVEAVGQIESRWQMDEYEGVLRVISQPGVWGANAMPGVQTFQVASSQSVLPLGFTTIQLPQPESLRTVRFDGTRAYAITAQQTDPLFTIDVSNPAAPAVKGALEMPGWIYHIEPRGDRLFALGFDNAAQGGSLNVSLIDVSSMTQPTMIERVAFGGQWSSLAEDQDRIHKAFSINEDLGLIMVPYSGYSYTGGPNDCGKYESGIQLIDFTQNSLTKRGAAESRGQARRALVNDGRLFAVSDEQVRTFNIDDRDAPSKVTEMALANNVNQSAVVGDVVVRVSSDWWTSETRLDVVSASDPSQADPIGALDLSSLAEENSPYGCWYYGFYGVKLLSHGQHVYMIWPSSDWTKTFAVGVDVTDPAHPTLGAKIAIDTPYTYYEDYSAFGQIVAPGDQVVQSGSTLVFRRLDGLPYTQSSDPAEMRQAWLDVYDFSNPAAPVKASTLELPPAAGHTSLRIEGSTVMTSHWVPLEDDSTKARFYFDRIDVSNPAAPSLESSVNVPGSLVSFNAASGKLLTVDYQRLTLLDVTADACYQQFGYMAKWEPATAGDYQGPGECVGLTRAFKLTSVDDGAASLLDESPIAKNVYFNTTLVGDDRVFASYSNGGAIYAEDGFGWGGSSMMVVGGMANGELAVAFAPDETTQGAYLVAASGKRAIMSGYAPVSIGVLDATNMGALSYETAEELRAYPYDVKLAGDKALCSLGPFGLQVVDVSP